MSLLGFRTSPIPNRGPQSQRTGGHATTRTRDQFGRQADSTLIVPEKLGLESRAEFRREAAALLDEMGIGSGRLVLDCRRTKTIDSAGLNTLTIVHRRARKMRVPIVLVGLHADLRALLALTKLEDLFEWQDADIP